MKLSVEVKLGIIITASIAVVIWGLNFLKGKNILKPANDYYALYNNVSGLDKNAKVFYKGYRVGQVDKIYFNEDGSGTLTVAMSINKPYKLPLNAVAEVYSADLMGTKAIRIMGTESGRLHKPGDTLRTSISPGLDHRSRTRSCRLKIRLKTLSKLLTH